MDIFALPAEGADVVTLTWPTPQPRGHEVLLEVRQTGVCHTDMHLREGGYDLGSRGFLRMSTRGVTFPLVAGHEILGEVVAVGPDVATVRRGDVRLVYPWLGCGECGHCRVGRENYCADGQMLGIQRFGGFARQVHVPHERYLLDTTGLDEPWAATLACSGLTSYSAVSKVMPLDPEDWVAVIGTGGVGLMAVAVLRALGHRAIAVIDVNDDRLALAMGMGARIAINSSAGLGSADVVTRLGGPLIAAVDFVNSGQTADLAFGALAKGGTLVSVGLFGGEVTIPTALVAIKCLTIRGSFVGTLAELEELIALARRGGLPQTPVIGGELGADALNAALDALAAGTVRGRIVLSQPGAPTPASVGRHARDQSPTTGEV